MKEKFKASCVVLETAGVGVAIGNALLNRPGSRSWLCDYDPTLGKVERVDLVLGRNPLHIQGV
jgi:hypothetical protein